MRLLWNLFLTNKPCRVNKIVPEMHPEDAQSLSTIEIPTKTLTKVYLIGYVAHE